MAPVTQSTDTGNASETYYQTGLNDGIISPKENIGAYRSQLLDSLSGKLIRIDAMTGDGLASNPFFDVGKSTFGAIPRMGAWPEKRFQVYHETGLGQSLTQTAGNPGRVLHRRRRVEYLGRPEYLENRGRKFRLACVRGNERTQWLLEQKYGKQGMPPTHCLASADVRRSSFISVI